MVIEQFDSEETETILGVVRSEASYGKSLYVELPRFDKSRRTDGGAADRNTTSVEFAEDIYSYTYGEYVMLTFEPRERFDDHVLTHVERADLQNPVHVEEETFPNTDIPVTCPICGREASALVKTEYNSMTGGKLSDNADACTVHEKNRGSWFGLSGEHTFVHGVDN